MRTLAEFLAVWAAVYAATFGMYLAFGTAFHAFTRRFPQRRIQPHRLGEKRMGREIRQSALSLTVTCFCLAFGLYAQHRGWSLVAPLPLTWWSVLLMGAVSIVAFDAWFYFGHRFMHTRLMYRFHALHHRSVAPTVWSNYNDDLVDAFVMQCYYLWAPLILPIPALVLIGHRLYDHFNGMIGHSGFEFAAGKVARAPWPMVCTTFHDQHHSAFRYNYANFFSLWDRICGTLHPTYDRAVSAWESGTDGPTVTAGRGLASAVPAGGRAPAPSAPSQV